MSSIGFYVPSYKRAGKVKTGKWLTSAILCVHEFEADEYKEKEKNKLLIIPDDLKGNMAKVRNFILDNSVHDVTCMLDDDISEVGFYEFDEISEKMKFNKITQGDLFLKIDEWRGQSEDLGTILFGMNLQSDPKFYREYSPISLQSPVLGTFCCILKTNLRYDERLGLNEDYDFALQVLQKHHKILRWNKYSYKADHLTMAGGCGAYRVLDEEKAQAEIMISKWGKKIVSYDFKKSTNPRIRSPFKGI